MVFNKLPLLFFLAFSAALLFKTAFLKRNGVHVRAKNETKNKANYFLYPAFTLVLLLWLFELIKAAFSLSITVLPAILTKKILQCLICQISGSAALLLALILWIITLLHFKNSLRFGLVKNNRGELITKGIFSLSRNPFFLSLDFYFIGVAILLPTVFTIGFSLTAIVSIHFFILKEERFLQKFYGEEYLAYKHKTRRYL